jgi:hypothetical protein
MAPRNERQPVTRCQRRHELAQRRVLVDELVLALYLLTIALGCGLAIWATEAPRDCSEPAQHP